MSENDVQGSSGSLPPPPGRMRAAATLAWATVVEMVRDRVLVTVLVFAAVLVLANYFVADFAFASPIKLTTDLGLSLIHLVASALAMFLGISAINRDLSSRSAYMVLTCPIDRGTYVVGRYAGVVLTVILCSGAMLALLAVVVRTIEDLMNPYVPPLSVDAYFLAAEVLILTAAAMFFSAALRAMPATIAALATFVVAHLGPSVRENARSAGSAARSLAALLYVVVPDLERLNVRGQLVYFQRQPVAPETYLLAALMVAAYVVLFLALAAFAFSRRELD